MKKIIEDIKLKILDVKDEIKFIDNSIIVEKDEEVRWELLCKKNDLECKTLRGLRQALIGMYEALDIYVYGNNPEDYVFKK